MTQRKPLKQVLIEDFDYTIEEAEQSIQDAQEDLMDRLMNGGDPFEVCYDHFGLEPDYLEDLTM